MVDLVRVSVPISPSKETNVCCRRRYTKLSLSGLWRRRISATLVINLQSRLSGPSTTRRSSTAGQKFDVKLRTSGARRVEASSSPILLLINGRNSRIHLIGHPRKVHPHAQRNGNPPHSRAHHAPIDICIPSDTLPSSPTRLTHPPSPSRSCPIGSAMRSKGLRRK